MRKIIVFALALFPCSPVAAQIKTATGNREINASLVTRDTDLERKVDARRKSEEAALTPEAKKKLSAASDAVIRRMAKTPGEPDFSAMATQEVQRQFGALSPRQSDILSFFVLSQAAKVLADKEALKDKLDSMNEMSEMTSMRLQMAMDRKSKLMTTLSNLLKKTSDTDAAITQNIK